MLMKSPRCITPEMFEAILLEITAGESVKATLRAHDINPRVFWGHVGSRPEAANRYACAKRAGVDRIAEEILEIADDESITPESRRVRIDPRKWLLAKLAPKKYGDLLHLEHSGSIDFAGELEAARKRKAAA